MIEESAVEAGLETLRPGLASDGFDLVAGARAADSSVQVILEAKADACLECLVPDSLIVQMLEDAIRQHDPSLVRVELLKKGFENLAQH